MTNEMQWTIADSALTAEMVIRSQTFRWRIINREYDEIPDGYWLTCQRWDGKEWQTLESTIRRTLSEAIRKADENRADWSRHAIVGGWWFDPVMPPRRWIPVGATKN